MPIPAADPAVDGVTATITGPVKLPSGTAPLEGTWYARIRTTVGAAIDYDGTIRAGEQTVYDDGNGASMTLPVGAYVFTFRASSVGANGQPVVLGPYEYDLEDDTLWGVVMETPAEIPVTPSDVVLAQDAAAEAVAANEAAQQVGTTNDTVIAGRVNDPASATRAALTRSAQKPVGQGELTVNAADQAGATMGVKIGNAVKAAIALGTRHAEVFIPPGEYDVPPNVFSDLAATLQTGLHIRGAGRESTRLRLVTGGAESWFYDNGSSQRINFMSFSDLCFTSDDSTGAFGNGFKMTSTGHEQGWSFTRCTFRGPLRRAFQTEGTVGADTIYLNDCRLLLIYGACLYINNPQSVLHQWTATNAEVIYGDVVAVGPNGGGDFRWFGGSLIMTNTGGDTTPHWLFNVTAGSGVGSGNGTFTAYSVRLEARSAYSGLVNCVGDLGAAAFDFEKCNLAGYGGASTGPHDAVVVGRSKTVTFSGCIIPDDFTYRITVAGGNGFSANETGVIFDNGSLVPLDLSDKIIFTNSPGYGRATARGCRARAATLTERVAVDFDINWANAAWGSWMAPTKRFLVKAAFTSWPNNTGFERTVKLPKDAIITGVRVMKPASGTSTSAYQLAIGNGDKTVTYGSSAAAQYKDAHNIVLTGQWIECGSTTNGRTVRLWAPSNGNAEAQSGGFAYIEYI